MSDENRMEEKTAAPDAPAAPVEPQQSEETPAAPEEWKQVPHCGVVAVVGRTNVGKSTLLNRMVGEKVSIVSDTVQTTRNLIRAILTEPRGQLVFLDTPGVHKAKGELGKNLNKTARSAVRGADAVLLVLDASEEPQLEDDGWFRRLAVRAPEEGITCLFALNKCDLKKTYADAYRKLWEEIRAEKESPLEPEWFNISALRGDGVDALLDRLFQLMPPGPLLFPEDVLTDYPRKLNIGDIIREKLFQRLRYELPHAVAVWVEDIIEKDGKWLVEAFIYVERPSQKAIVIGKKGRLLKRVKAEAEKELSEMYEVPVELDLWVKVEKNWRKNFWILRKLGYA